MIVGVMEIGFRIFDSFSLKDKRKVVKSMIDKTKRMFNVSIAEVGDNDTINYALLGLSCISNNKKVVESTFDKILDFYNGNFAIEITTTRKEFL